MTTRRKPADNPRPRADRPTTISLNNRSVTEWYAEYKARKALAEAGEPDRPAGRDPAR